MVEFNKILHHFYSDKKWSVSEGATYDEIEWLDETLKPTEAEMLLHDITTAEANELARVKRAKEYPPIGDQLDALWKGGQAQADMKVRIDAVKVKYPKIL